MTTPTPNLDVEARLQELESRLSDTRRSLRNTRRWLTMAGIAGFGLLAAAAADLATIDVLRAKRMEIVDDSGHVVLAASSDKSGGRVDFWNNQGCNFMRMASNENGGDVAIWNCDGKSVAGLYASASGGELSIWDNQGRRAARTLAGEDGGIYEVMKGDKLLAALKGTMLGSAMELLDNNGDAIVSASTADEYGYLGVGQHVLLASNEEWGAVTIKGDHGHQLLQLKGDTRKQEAMLTLKTSNGSVHLETGNETSLPKVAVHNSNGKLAAHMTVRTEGGGVLTASSSEGTEVASIRSDAQGNGRVDLSDQAGTLLATMQTLPARGATLALMAPNKTTACAMAASEDGGVLNLSNGQGTPVLVGGIASGRRDGAISVYNHRGIPVVNAGSTVGGIGQVVINDDNGHRVLTLPQRFTTSMEPPVQE